MNMDNTVEENLENDQNLFNKSSEKVAKAGDTVLDNLRESDSDGDDIILQKKVKRNLLDSDDETILPKEQTVDGNDSNDCPIERNIPTKMSHKRFTIIDSDSEDVEYPTPHNKHFEENSNREAPIYGLNEKGETVIESLVDEHMKKRLSVLCDSDSSPDEQDNVQEFTSSELRKHTQTQKSNCKSTARKPKEQKPTSMSAKDALIQRKEIRSESQRMTREMNLSLPYHKPKTRTLQEFLQKRPRFAATIPSNTLNTPPSVALKMSKKDLEIVSQNMLEREKQVEEFFKSESESEEETLPATDKAEKIITEENDDTKDMQNEISNGTVNQEKSDLNEPENTTVTEENVVLDCNADNVENESDSHVDNTKSIVVLQNILLNRNDENFDSGILDDFASTNKTVLTGLDSTDGPTVQLSLEKSEMDLLMDKYDVGKSDSINKDEELNVSKTPKINVLELVKDKLGDVPPRLSGTSDDFINFDENVNKLQQRFVKHTTKKQHHKHNVEVDIVSITNGEIRTEKFAMSVDDDEIPILEKPGERLKQLKTELEMQMAKRRSKFWEQRVNSKKDDKVDDSKKGDSDDEKDNILDIEDEDEFTEIEDDEDDDLLDKSADVDEDEAKLNAKCAFGDDEAVESDDHEENMDADDDGNLPNDVVEEEESSMDADDEDEPLTGDTKKKKKLKRIVKAFENDSDDDQPSTPLFQNKIVNRTKSTDLLFDTTDTLEDLSGPTPHQRQDQRTPTKRTTTLTRSDLGFLTPVIQLTGLQSLNSGSKFLHDSPVSPFRMPQSSPHMSQSGPQKKLFADSQTLDEDIEELCSGKFTTQTEPEHDTTNTNMSSNTNKESAPSLEIEETCEEERPQTTNTQEFLEVCSGKFTGITQLESSSKISEKNFEGNEEGSSRNNYYFTNSTGNKEIKTLDDEDDGKLISQLLDEEEMERFKKKFDSPEKLSSQNDGEEIVKIGRVIFDSSDEEEYETEERKKKRRKNFISDDDDEDSKVLVDDDDEEEEFENMTTNVVEYDSEENEIEITEGVVAPKKLKASDFFENEAELSESEWGSADEDEKDLDVLELEDGDTEKLDEDQVKRDLERIHMRRVLDDDNYEVKMLQEMLLADGELHGSGRERQFKWRNMDSMGNEDSAPKDDDGEVYLDDENEDEEKWRKMRHEREAFLKRQQEKSQTMEDDNSIIATKSQIFKLGQAAIKRSLSNTPNNTIIEKRPVAESPEIKTSFTLMSKKGSFLTRSERVLQKVAEFTSKTVNLTIGGPKNSKNFVFQSVATEAKEIVNKDLKRKAMDGTPVAIKKLRLDTISPAVQKKNQKTERAKKLFSNW